ncbi:hypothetical protein ACIQGZ_04805 [Streptomyces sp. NPDC092296]|uniref:hypothetical protein n=1 Tax=Streptomyces sp. NPDC092296 TaxID=3366012 RepID=UPI003819CA5D
MDTESELKEKAVALRRGGMSRRQIRDVLGIRSDEKVGRLLQGEPPPEWTRRPRAKDGLRQQARELRAQGRNYDEISGALGVSKSSVSLWVRDLPKPPQLPAAERARRAAEARWEPLRRQREEERRLTKAAAAREVGALSPRDLFMTGIALYWAEGAKDKPYARREKVRFTNSDPDVISLFIAWLDLLGVQRSRLRFYLHIHESADVAAAEQYWMERVEADRTQFGKTILKKHNPVTNRQNVGTAYRGCLAVGVLNGAELYRRIEGWWSGIVVETTRLSP